MLKNYIKIAWRSLLRNRSTFVINVTGLAIGISSFLLILKYVSDEWSYDRHFKDADRIFRTVLHAKMGEEQIDEASVMAPVGKTFQREIPEVESSLRLAKMTDATMVSYNDRQTRKGLMALADSNFFEFFSLPLLKGDARTALSKPRSVVLTKEQAMTYFGNEEALNKTIEIKEIGIWSENGFENLAGFYTVTGVMEELPSNTHFHADLLASMNSSSSANSPRWLSGSYYTYIKVHKGISPVLLEDKMKQVTLKYLGPQLQQATGQSLEEFEEKGNRVGLFVQALRDIHLKSALVGEWEASGNGKTVYILAAVGLFMLLVACVNFMNLSTASASRRLKEIGLRKVLGSEKSQLVFQFLSEAFLSTLFAFCVAFILFAVALPAFNRISGKHIEFIELLQPFSVVGLGCMVFIISLLAGLYPAFFMSGFKPVLALKNRFTSSGSKGLRSGLVIFQFVVSATLIIGTIVVSRQMSYIQNKDIGYNRKSLIVLRDAGRLGKNLEVFKNELKSDSRVINITTSAYVPAGPSDNSVSAVGRYDDPNEIVRAHLYNIDEAYIPTLGMKLIAGRNFSKEYAEESTNIIINETAIQAFGLPEDPIGSTLTMKGGNDGDGDRILTVVGVVKDFHTRSLKETIPALVMSYMPYYGLMVRANEADLPGLIHMMEKQWNEFNTGEAFQYSFLDELYNETYLKEANLNVILRVFALLTIFVACLGLFGLITFSTEQRIKEIGIRKTLGSSVTQIVGVLSFDFLKLIGVSLVIAFPLGYYVMNAWLQDFEYRIEFQWWFFALAAFITLLIAMVTISFKSVKAALVNPVKSLGSE